MPDASLLIGGPRDGELMAIPGLLNPFLVAEPLDIWELMKLSPYEPSFKTHFYELDGVFKVYRYKGLY